MLFSNFIKYVDYKLYFKTIIFSIAYLYINNTNLKLYEQYFLLKYFKIVYFTKPLNRYFITKMSKK